VLGLGGNSNDENDAIVQHWGCGKLPKDMKNASISKLKFKGSENPRKLNIFALPSLLQHEKLKNKVQGINDFQF
jgi:hypothetical protein